MISVLNNWKFNCDTCNAEDCDDIQPAGICDDFYPDRETIRRLFREEFWNEINALKIGSVDVHGGSWRDVVFYDDFIALLGIGK